MKYDTDAVIIAAGITTIIVFSLTIFAFQVVTHIMLFSCHIMDILFLFSVVFIFQFL